MSELLKEKRILAAFKQQSETNNPPSSPLTIQIVDLIEDGRTEVKTYHVSDGRNFILAQFVSPSPIPSKGDILELKDFSFRIIFQSLKEWIVFLEVNTFELIQSLPHQQCGLPSDFSLDVEFSEYFRDHPPCASMLRDNDMNLTDTDVDIHDPFLSPLTDPFFSSLEILDAIENPSGYAGYPSDNHASLSQAAGNPFDAVSPNQKVKKPRKPRKKKNQMEDVEKTNGIEYTSSLFNTLPFSPPSLFVDNTATTAMASMASMSSTTTAAMKSKATNKKKQTAKGRKSVESLSFSSSSSLASLTEAAESEASSSSMYLNGETETKGQNGFDSSGLQNNQYLIVFSKAGGEQANHTVNSGKEEIEEEAMSFGITPTFVSAKKKVSLHRCSNADVTIHDRFNQFFFKPVDREKPVFVTFKETDLTDLSQASSEFTIHVTRARYRPLSSPFTLVKQSPILSSTSPTSSHVSPFRLIHPADSTSSESDPSIPQPSSPSSIASSSSSSSSSSSASSASSASSLFDGVMKRKIRRPSFGYFNWIESSLPKKRQKITDCE